MNGSIGWTTDASASDQAASQESSCLPVITKTGGQLKTSSFSCLATPKPPSGEVSPSRMNRSALNGAILYSKTNDSLTVKFSDDSHTYTLIIMIDLKEAIPKDPQKDFDIDQIEKCYIKFKKYDLDTFEVIGQITKNAEIKKIDEDFIINLKLELDEKFEGDEENFKIETE